MARTRFSRVSILIIFLVLMVSGIYLAYGPTPAVFAACGEGQCEFASKCYDGGACVGIQWCHGGQWETCKICCEQP
jgi:hypothetical protein